MKYLKRNITDDIKEYLKHFPALLINGARQVGKSTLALHLNVENYITLDDINMYEMAKNDPQTFVQNIEKPVVLDEIQRLPELLVSIKEYIDKDRKNGQFILTGSASIRSFKNISDSLAGRIGIVDLYPLSLKEKNAKSENIIDIFSSSLDEYVLKKYDNSQITQNIINGGYPQIETMDSEKARYLWFSSYIRTYIESDARELANIRNIDKFVSLYRLCMLRSGGIFNKHELQNECGLDNRTFDSYFNVLENTYQLKRLEPYFANELKRVIKSPKIYALDSGILSYLLQIKSASEYETSTHKGALLETFVYSELLKAQTYAQKSAKICYLRTSDKKEVDFILDFTSKVIAIEIKASKSVNKSDFKHIYHLAQNMKEKFDKGIILYGGESVLKLDEKMYAFPLGFLG